MKIKYAIAASLLLSIGAYAQKEELKALKKISEKEKPTPADVTETKTLLDAAESKMSAATPEQQAEFNFYKGRYAFISMAMNPASGGTNFPLALEGFNKVIEIEKAGKKKYTEQVEKIYLPEMKTMAVTMAQQLGERKMYKESGMAYYAAYMVDTKDYAILYNAAANAVNSQDWDNALKYYEILDKSGFTGESISYVAKNKSTGVVESFPNKSTRDIAVKGGLYINPQDEKQPSVKGEIVKNIALIYNMKGDTEKAKTAFVNARKANPDDVSLIIGEADLYLKSKDMVKYKQLITEAVAKNPNDADLFYNLGVVTAETDAKEATAYYQKALQIKPDYVNANINLGLLQLKDEQKLVDQMNSITGNTAKDNQRYDELKKQKDAMYVKALPYFEKAHKDAPDNQYVITTLATMYQAMDKQAEYKAMKAKIKS
jgi:tetratricopeptide (TPR) repeat protein